MYWGQLCIGAVSGSVVCSVESLNSCIGSNGVECIGSALGTVVLNVKEMYRGQQCCMYKRCIWDSGVACIGVY